MSFTHWNANEPITANRLNEMLRQTQQQIVAGTGIGINKIGDQVVISVLPLGMGTESINPFVKVVDVYDDSILVAPFDPASSYTSAYQAKTYKPYALRRSPFDGSTITYIDGTAIAYTYSTGSDSYRKRTATNIATSQSITEVITPDYYVGEILRIHLGNWGTTDPYSTEIEDRMRYEDMNIGAKAWAKEPS